MSANTFGKIYRLTSFGESHGVAVGGIIDGCPPNVSLDLELVQKDLDRRRPGQSSITTSRKEYDKIEILSGILNGKTLGTPIAFSVRNKDAKPQDYENLKEVYRPSHADYTYEAKYGIRDHRGGGRQSARETLARVVAGSIAKQVLQQIDVKIIAFTSQVGHISLPSDYHYDSVDQDLIESNIVRCPHADTSQKMIDLIKEVKEAGDSIGGTITGIVYNTPIGIGSPVFDKLHADLGKAMLSINAVKGFDYGSGFQGLSSRGSELNDSFVNEGGIRTTSNNSGGIQGGISNGEEIYFRVAFKPVATIGIDQKTVTKKGDQTNLAAKGRHDPCVLPRAVPIVEAMTAMTILDHVLLSQTTRISQ
ncbi:MAG: chorismate synthase [Flavobacteriales bacterium]|nr:chorismate synthase [Flavobacteriales bacterium]